MGGSSTARAHAASATKMMQTHDKLSYTGLVSLTGHCSGCKWAVYLPSVGFSAHPLAEHPISLGICAGDSPGPSQLRPSAHHLLRAAPSQRAARHSATRKLPLSKALLWAKSSQKKIFWNNKKCSPTVKPGACSAFLLLSTGELSPFFYIRAVSRRISL